MDARSENALSMAVTVTDYLDRNQPIWGSVASIGRVLTAVKASIGRINELVRQQNVTTKGATAGKRSSRAEMESLALEVAGAVRAYASENDDRELFEKVNYSASDLRNARDTEVNNLCTGIHAAANGVVQDLADAGVTPQKLTTLQSRINEYVVDTPKPRTTRSGGKAAGKGVGTELETLQRLLEEQLDGLIEQFKAAQPVFYEGYKAARVIIDHPGGRNSKSEDGNNPPPPQ